MPELNISPPAQLPPAPSGANEGAGGAKADPGADAAFSGLLAGKLDQAARKGDAPEPGAESTAEAARAERAADDPDGASEEALPAPDATAQILAAIGLAPLESVAIHPQGGTVQPEPGNAVSGDAAQSGAPLTSDEKPAFTPRGGPALQSAEPFPAAAGAAQSTASALVAASAERAGAELGAAMKLSAFRALPAADFQAPTAVHTSFAPAIASGPQPSAPATVSVPGTVGTPAWTEDFASTVSLLATQKVSSAEIRVQPAELGPVQVSIRIERGETSMNFAALHSDTRQALEAALPRLREMLAESGISLGEASVGAESFGQNPRHGETAAPRRGIDALGQSALPAPAARAPLRSNQLVDTFA